MKDNKLVIFSVSISAVLLFGIMNSCFSNTKEGVIPEQKDSVVFAIAETTPVVSVKGEDAADDPAIWVNSNDPSKSFIIGTNKKGGLCVYKINGEEIFYAPVGNVNNVDLRYGFPLSNRKVDIIATTNRTYNTLQIFTISPETGVLTDITRDTLKSTLKEVYGIAMYKSKISNKYFAFISGKFGGVEQWELKATNDEGITARIVRKLSIGSQSEGLVADDETGMLYVAEEKRGIWRFNAEPDSSEMKVIIASSDSLNPKISYDLEGLAIYYAKNSKGYLIASSQGNNSYSIFELEEPNRYLGSFKVGVGTIDEVEETDGLDVCNTYLGEKYPNGIFIVQDGVNTDKLDTLNQNFKIVVWKDIAYLFNPPLIIDTSYLY
jgi:3-phytase